ncbi:UNVERIFIED_ORG: alkylation response protein AidB-like acyl-CoA dehydrogenase [Paraburkholderia sediminicola]|nr:alkylation response protein AidB-like acyl-CoA dehydrogenase [Paraburkholderia sediminicola]
MDLPAEFDQQLTQRGRHLIALASNFAGETLQRTVVQASSWAQQELRSACALGLAGIEVPEEFGGCGLPFAVRARVAEELCRVDFAFGFALINHHNAIARIAAHGTDEAKAAFVSTMLRGDAIGCTAMSEPEAGSDFGAISTMARRTSDGWVLQGTKRWIANAAGANVLLTFAQTDEQQGSREGIACFIVDGNAKGFERRPVESMPGLASAGIGGFELRAYHAQDKDVLYPPGQGFTQAMAGVNKARTHVAAMACGMVAASLDSATRHARARKAFGRPLFSHQGLRWSLADVATTLAAMRLLTYRATRLIDLESRDSVMAAAMAKKYAAEQCLPAIAACVQAMGAIGMSADSALARFLTAAPAIGIADGTSGMMRERIGALLEKADC